MNDFDHCDMEYVLHRLHVGQYLLHQELVGGVGAAVAMGGYSSTGMGVKGTTGAVGATLAKGAAGAMGTAVATGAAGATGAVGATGVAGAMGAVGAIGAVRGTAQHVAFA